MIPENSNCNASRQYFKITRQNTMILLNARNISLTLRLACTTTSRYKLPNIFEIVRYTSFKVE